MQFKLWIETHWGDELFKQKKVWMLPFKSVQKDQEGWYIDWNKFPGSISDPEETSPGDKVTDMSLNMTPYWEIEHTTPNGRIYLKPIEPNPILKGVGAGGKILDDHDYDVLSGSYEQKRIDQILQAWKSGEATDIRDITYLLLGTVPTNFGPNGAQGGWYNANDTGSNRGGNKAMSAKEIMQKDAHTLKNVFGFEVPKSALDGTLDPYQWNGYVNGDPSRKEIQLDVESDDPRKMAQLVLTHHQPSVRLRATEWLIDHYMYSGTPKDLMSRDDWKDQREKNIRGDFRQKDLDKLIKDTAIKLAKSYHPKQKEGRNFDPYWHSKEKFILLAQQLGWDDVINAYEDSKDGTNREYVLRSFVEKQDADSAIKMLEKEKDPMTLSSMLERCSERYNRPKDFVMKMSKYIMDNRAAFQKIANSSSEKWIKEKIEDSLKRANINLDPTRAYPDD